MKRFGEFLQAVGFIGALLFMSGADLNEIRVTICGILANCLLVAAGAGFAKIRRKKRARGYNFYRGAASAAGVVVATGMLAAAINIANATPAQAAAPTVETQAEPIVIEIHSEYDVIKISEAPPIQAEAETAAALQPEQTMEPEEAAGFIYLEEIPLTYDQQKMLYTMWTGAGYDYITALALADAETGGTFSTSAINHDTHDYGMFQLNRASWAGTFKREFGISTWEDMMDYELNIRGAIYVYGDCVDRYGETERAIVAYNMGYAKFDSTKYSRKVLSNYEKWQAAYQAAREL